MIWALAGLGDEPAPFKSYTSDYTPTTMPVVERPPVTTPLTPQPMTPDATTGSSGGTFAGFDTTMTVGVIAAVAVLGLIVYRGEMTPNGKRRNSRKRYPGYKGKYRAGVKGSTRVMLKLHHSGRGSDESSLKKALSDLRRHKLKGKVERCKLPSGKKTWSITVRTTVAKADSFQVKMGKSRGQSYESYID